MADEVSADKWSLLATHPTYLGAIAELYPTSGDAHVRAVALRLDGYTVNVAFLRLRVASR